MCGLWVKTQIQCAWTKAIVASLDVIPFLEVLLWRPPTTLRSFSHLFAQFMPTPLYACTSSSRQVVVASALLCHSSYVPSLHCLTKCQVGETMIPSLLDLLVLLLPALPPLRFPPLNRRWRASIGSRMCFKDNVFTIVVCQTRLEA